MNILHISDLHFGPRHWEGNDNALLDKINSYPADIVINTGDSTSDGLENEFEMAGNFLEAITCENIISIIGNHDKRNMRGHEFFRQYIDDTEIIYPLRPQLTTKKNLFLDREIAKINENFTDLNFIKTLYVDGESLLIISIDSNELYEDNGFIEKELLRSVSRQISHTRYDKILLLTHHSILTTDADPLKNSMCLLDFVREHKIEYVYCGHTHKLELGKFTDLYHGHTFTQYMCGTLSSCNHKNDDNMFLFYENWGTDQMHVRLVRIFPEGNRLQFKEETIF